MKVGARIIFIALLWALTGILAGCQRDDLYGFPAPLATDRPIYVYIGRHEYGGLVGGRAGADSICRQVAYLHPVSGYAGNFKALISVDEWDQMKNVVPSTRWISPVFAIRSDGGMEPLSGDWIGLFDGSINMTLATAFGIDYSNWWTGSSFDGSCAAGSTCNGWTDSGATGMEGLFNSVGPTWLDNGAVTCTMYQMVMCVAF